MVSGCTSRAGLLGLNSLPGRSPYGLLAYKAANTGLPAGETDESQMRRKLKCLETCYKLS